MDDNPASLIPEELRQAGEGEVVRIDLNRPMSEVLEELKKYPVATRLSLNGTIIVGRDIAHAKLKERLDRGEELPQYIKDHPIYYAGPAKTPEGMACGSMGPTTAGRMDPYVDLFQSHGGSMIMLAKGNRSQAVTDACKKHGGFYLGSIGGPAAILAQNNINSIECVEFPELGMEAVWKIEVEDFPAFILVDNKVNDFFKPVKQKYVDSGRINAKSMATDAQALVYKVPGGMLSNMIANLTDMKAMDKFEAALAEIPAVRKDLGYPPLVTPLSQMVGNQAVTNVLLGQRYKQVSKEVKNYFKGEYGIAPAPVSEELQKQILGEGGKPVDCRIEDAKRTGEDFQKAKEALGDLARSEEDVMSYICYPDQTMKFLTDRKAKEENICKYSIVEA